MRYKPYLVVKALFIGKISNADQTEHVEGSEFFRFDLKDALNFAKLLSTTYLNHEDGQAPFEVLWRALLTDFAANTSPADPKYAMAFTTYASEQMRQLSDASIHNIDMGHTQTTDISSDLVGLKGFGLSHIDTVETTETTELSEVRGRLLVGMANWRLFLSDTGHFGCGDVRTSVGDFSVVLGGFHVPVVLRQGSGGRFQVIGEAYVHGIMLGEAVNSGAKWESITLE